MEEDEASSNITRKNEAKFLCTPIGSMKKSFVKQKSTLLRKHAALAGNTSVVFKQSLTSNNRQLAKTLEKTKQELADAQNTIISLVHENNVLSSKVLAFRRLAESKNDEIEHEVQSRVQQRFNSIGDMINDAIRNHTVTTDRLTAAADACRGFTAKTLENLFDESIQYCSKLPSRVPVGAQRWHPIISTCREQVDPARDELGTEDIAESNEPRLRVRGEVCTPDNQLSATMQLDTSSSSFVNETVLAPPEDQSLVHSTDVSASAADSQPPKPLLIHDDIPVGPRLSGSAARSEQGRKSDTAKPDGPIPNSGLYEVVLSPPKIFRKYIDASAPTASSSCTTGVRKNQPGTRRTGSNASAAKNATHVTLPPAATGDLRSRRRSTFSLGRSQEAKVDMLADTGTSITDESDSILIATPDLDVTLQGERLPLDTAGECDADVHAPTHAVDSMAASSADPCHSGTTAATIPRTSSKTTGSHETASQSAKAPTQSAPPSRQMDIVMSKPGELHFVVGSRDGTRQPNLSDVRPAASSRSKKRQTFVASSVKLPSDGTPQSVAEGKGHGASVFDFKGTPVVAVSKDAVDAYELSLSESLVSELPRQQYRSEAGAAAAAAAAAAPGVPLVRNDQRMLKGFKQPRTKEKVPCSTSAESETHVGSEPFHKSVSPPPGVKSKHSKKLQDKARQQQQSTKENAGGHGHSSSPTAVHKTVQKAPLSPSLSTQCEKAASAAEHLLPAIARASMHVTECSPAAATDSGPAQSPSRRGHEDSLNMFSDSMIEQYRQAIGDTAVAPKHQEPVHVVSIASAVMSSDTASCRHAEPDTPGHFAAEQEVPKRRRCASSVSYAEPPLGKKLRRGDPGTSSIYGADVATISEHQKRSSTKHAKGPNSKHL